MTRVFSILFISLFLSSTLALSQPQLSQYKISGLPDKDMNQIAEKYEIIANLGKGSYEVIIPYSQREDFLKLAPDAFLQEKDIHSFFNQRLAENKDYFEGYQDFTEVEALMKKWAKENPDRVELGSYGKSTEGRSLWFVKISSDLEKDDNTKPKVMINAATHGDEIITTEVLIRLIDELLQRSKVDGRLSDIIQNYDLYFVPVINPDGFTKRRRYAGGRDPNRDFPYPERPTRTSVACIKHLIDWVDKEKFDGTLDIHAYSRLVMYPWSYTKNPIEDATDELDFQHLVSHMSEENQYTHGQISKTIYVAKGSSSDYFYWKNKSVSLAVELGRSKAPRSSQIPSYVDESREMIWRFIESFLDKEKAH